MCKALKVSRASYYKETKKKNPVDPESHLVEKLFIENKRSYGTRRLKKACKALGWNVNTLVDNFYKDNC